MSRLIGCLAVSGCYSERSFLDDYVERYCASNVSCADEQQIGVAFTDEAECEAFLRTFHGFRTAGCDYDPRAASACVEALEGPCGAPSSDCDAVFSGDRCGWDG